MLLDEGTQTGRTHFFLTLENEFDVVFEQPLLGYIFKSLGLNERLAFVVVGSAGPDMPVAHLRFKRFALPKFERFGRHHVVMPVDEHRLGVGVYHLFAVDHGVSSRWHHLGAVGTGHQQQFFPPFGTAQHVGFVCLLGTDTGDANQAEELLQHPFLVFLDILFDHKLGLMIVE